MKKWIILQCNNTSIAKFSRWRLTCWWSHGLSVKTLVDQKNISIENLILRGSSLGSLHKKNLTTGPCYFINIKWKNSSESMLVSLLLSLPARLVALIINSTFNTDSVLYGTIESLAWIIGCSLLYNVWFTQRFCFITFWALYL